MKKGLLITMILFMAVTMLYAGDNNSNISTGYLRNPVRNSVINNLDATIFNPAGTTELEDGFHIGVQNEIVLRNYSYDEIDLSGGYGLLEAPDGESDDNTYLFPTVMLDYTRDNWSAFFTLTVPGGGGTVTYDPLVSIDTGFLASGGNPLAASGSSTDIELEASSQILGYTFGGAYKFLDMISVSGGVRVLQAKATTKATTDLPSPYDTLADSEYTAVGVGGIFGINVMPMDGLNIAMRYETAVKMDYESDDDGAEDYRHDFPAYFGMGVGYRVIPKLQLMADFGFNFYEQQAGNSDTLEAVEDDIENGWTLGFGAEYDITERIMASAGICYTDSGVNEDSAVYSFSGMPVPNPNPDLGRTTLGMGGEFEVIDDFTLEFGYMLVLYRGIEDANEIEYNKEVHGFSLGAAYHF